MDVLVKFNKLQIYLSTSKRQEKDVTYDKWNMYSIYVWIYPLKALERNCDNAQAPGHITWVEWIYLFNVDS